MRILIVSHYFWPESFRINDLATGLSERGHEITVLTGMPNYPIGHWFSGYSMFSPSKELWGNISIYRIPVIPRGRGQRWRLALNYLSYLIFASLLAPFRCRKQYDWIFVYEPSPVTVALPAILLKTIKKIPIMLWVQDLWPETLAATGAIRSWWILSLMGRIVRFIYEKCNLILVQSKGFIQSVTDRGANPSKVVYFPNWAESLYQPVAVDHQSEEISLLPAGFRIMFAGNIGTAQSLDVFLDAAEELKDYQEIHWVILGEGQKKVWVEREVHTRGLQTQVHLLGRHPMEKMPTFFSLADVLLVLLKKDPIFSLTIPSKVQTYLASGRPILASLEGSGAEVIELARGGLVCPPGDSNALAKAALQLFHMSKSERERLGKQGRQFYEEHFERNMLIDRLVTMMNNPPAGSTR